jgi:hypothetical protein
VPVIKALRVINTNDFVVGFKGYMAGDAAMVLAEWIPIYFTHVDGDFGLGHSPRTLRALTTLKTLKTGSMGGF